MKVDKKALVIGCIIAAIGVILSNSGVFNKNIAFTEVSENIFEGTVNGKKHKVTFKKEESSNVVGKLKMATLIIELDGKSVPDLKYTYAYEIEVDAAIANGSVTTIKDTANKSEYLMITYNYMGLPVITIVDANGQVLIDENPDAYVVNDNVISSKYLSGYGTKNYKYYVEKGKAVKEEI